jgi:cytochrome c biogenesis protein CcmG, thiol:disulfide interchange protein DsbE
VFFVELSKLPNRAACLVAIAVSLGISACGGSGGGDSTAKAPDYTSALAGAPKPLAKLYQQGDRLIGGGPAAFESQLDALRGYPVVVNVWASWCEPCRQEFPYLQRLSARYGKQVAFLGVDAGDSSAAARTFLGELPLPYPSYSDPDRDIMQTLGTTRGLPDTAYYDASGKRVFVKLGQYGSEDDFAADIRRYALGG